MGHFMIEVADHHPLKVFFQWFRQGRQDDCLAIGEGLVALADDGHTELLSKCSGQPFELAFKGVGTHKIFSFAMRKREATPVASRFAGAAQTAFRIE